jgi:rSAM/selenodomain-associated transferase 1
MNELALFAKHWRRGHVKTRLAAVVGDEQACELYRCFLRTSLTRLSRQGDRRFLVYSPPASTAEFRQFVGRRSWQLRPQVGGDLGARLSYDVQQSFDSGTARLVILGADSPTVPLDHVGRAFKLLESHEVVLGPTKDGGYYLIGLSRPQPELFAEIDWGTDRVWSQTMERLESVFTSPRVAILPRWYDVDRPADLQRLVAELAAAAPFEAPLQSLARCVQRAMGD